MGQEIAITVKDLVIRYRKLNKFSIKKQLLNKRTTNRKEDKMFEAIHGISFEVPKGEILGIIGKNGSGKSTLLRALAGIFSADEGSVDLHGHDISLLAIGVGFNKELSGRENIYLTGLLLGFTEEEIKQKTEDIIEFSELDHFIDQPVKTYSSGMYSKLGFSINAILETDIMLIDEVLSVGDEHFKKKSYAKMKSLISSKDRTVVIVSHSLGTLEQLCETVLWLNDGEIVKIGEASEVIADYREYMDQLEAERAKKKKAREAKKARETEEAIRKIEEETARNLREKAEHEAAQKAAEKAAKADE